jgi:hypothetical protein
MPCITAEMLISDRRERALQHLGVEAVFLREGREYPLHVVGGVLGYVEVRRLGEAVVRLGRTCS